LALTIRLYKSAVILIALSPGYPNVTIDRQRAIGKFLA